MTFTSSHAEDTCLNNQASSTSDDSNNTTTANNNDNGRTTSRPLSRTNSRVISRTNTRRFGAASAPTTPYPARDGVFSVDYFTVGATIASGHHHAFVPDPFAAAYRPGSNAVSPLTSPTSGRRMTSNGGGYFDVEKESDTYYDHQNDDSADTDAGKIARLAAGAAKFGSQKKRARRGAVDGTVSPRKPADAAVSEVDDTKQQAEQLERVEKDAEEQQQHGQADIPRPAPLRLARTVTFSAGGSGIVPPQPDIDLGRTTSRPRTAYSIESAGSSSYASSSASSDNASSVDQTPPYLTFPEGGRQAWLVVFASFCAMVSVFGLINTAAVFESWFATHQLAAYSASEIGWVFSLYLFFVFFVGIQVGPLFDRFGPRYLVAVGSVLVVASVMLLGFCEEYYQILLCYSVLGGLGGALLNTPAYACIAHFFNVRRGLATGIATTSGGVGGIVFPILLQQLLPRLGFAWSTRILGFILLGLSVPANLWLRTRLPLAGAGSAATDNGEAEMAADSASENSITPVRTAASTRSSLRNRVPSVWPDFTIFRDKCYAVAAVGVFFMEWGIFVPLTFIVSYASAHGQDTNQAYTLLSLLNAGSVLGRFLPGLLADKYGRFNVIIVTIVLSSAVVLGAWLPAGDSHPVLIAFAVLFGFASGSNLGLIAVCLGQLCEPREYGRYYSTAMMVASFGTLSSVPIGGAILGKGDSEGGWLGLIAFSGVSYAVAALCYITARVMAVGWNPRTRF